MNRVITEMIRRRFEKTDRPVLIAVGGPGGTGKSEFSTRLADALPDSAVLRLDDYKASRHIREREEVFGPHPKANKMVLLKKHLDHIRNGRRFHKPVYRSDWGGAVDVEPYAPARFNILDGEVSTYPEFREWVDFSIFIDSDLELQLKTRLERDTAVRGHSEKKALRTFLYSNLLEFPEYGAEGKARADVRLFCREGYALEFEEGCLPPISTRE